MADRKNMQIDRTTAKEEWLAEILSKIKPLTQQQRDVLVPAFKRAAQAHTEQQRMEVERSKAVLPIRPRSVTENSAPFAEDEKTDTTRSGIEEQS